MNNMDVINTHNTKQRTGMRTIEQIQEELDKKQKQLKILNATRDCVCDEIKNLQHELIEIKEKLCQDHLGKYVINKYDGKYYHLYHKFYRHVRGEATYVYKRVLAFRKKTGKHKLSVKEWVISAIEVENRIKSGYWVIVEP